MIKSILDYVYDYISPMIPSGTEFRIGALPVNGGVALSLATGGIETPFEACDKVCLTTFTLNAKSNRQDAAIELLDNIHRTLSTTRDLHATDEIQFISFSSLTYPTYLGKDEQEMYMYGSSIQVKWYLRKTNL